MLLIDDRQSEIRELDRLLHERMRAHDDPAAREVVQTRPADGFARSSSAARRSAAGSEPVSSVTPWPSGSRSRRSAAACWRASRSVGASSAPCRPASATNAERQSRHGRLAGTDVALQKPHHRPRPTKVGGDLLNRRGLVRSQASRLVGAGTGPNLRREGRLHCADRVPELDRSDFHGLSDGDPPLAVAGHHADFQGQELVEAEPAQGGVASGERLRVVGVLQRRRDGHRRLARARPLGPSALAAPPWRRPSEPQPAGTPGTSPTLSSASRIARRRVVAVSPAVSRYIGTIRPACSSAEPSSGWNSGLSKRGGEAAATDLAADDDPIALAQPLLDVAPPEPGRLHLARVVAEMGRGSLYPTPERRRHTNPAYLQARAGRLAVRNPGQFACGAELAQVVVAAGQVEEQVAHGPDPERGPTRRKTVAPARPLMPIGVSSPTGPRVRAAPAPAVRVPLPNSLPAIPLLGRDEVPVVGLPAVDDLHLHAGPPLPHSTGQGFGLGQIRACAVVDRDQLEARLEGRQERPGPPSSGRR